MRLARFGKYLAFGLITAFGVLGGLFAAGYAFEDPGGWLAVAITAGWVVPVLALAILGLRAPRIGAPVMVAITCAVIAFNIADATFRAVPRDAWGPVGAISALGLGVSLGFLGLRRSKLAGLLLVSAGTAQFIALLAGMIGMGADGPGIGGLLGGSSGAVVVPLVVVGVLFLAAGFISGEGWFTDPASGATDSALTSPNL